jgi:hypothetical protein
MKIHMRTLCVLTLLSASGCTKHDERETSAPSMPEAPPPTEASPAAPKVEPQTQQAAPETPKAEPETVKVAVETGPPKVERFEVKVDGAQVKLSWAKPSGSPLVRVLRSVNVAPDAVGESATAAPPTLVYVGKATSTTHPISDLLPDDPSASGDARHEYQYAAFACTTANECKDSPGRATLRPTLVECLRGGGYLIHWRHANSDVCQDVEPLGTAADTKTPNWWKSCNSDCATATARQLNNEGIEQAKQLGLEMARLKIPIARVVSTEFCRGIQTAQNMALKYRGKPLKIETAKELTSFVYDEKNRCSNVYKMLAQAPAKGTNTALIGQKGNDCPVIGKLDIAAAAVFKPDGAGGSQVAGVVKLADWAAF